MSGKSVVIPVAVRWSDQDLNGHVNNAVIVTLVEEARVKWRLAAVAAGGLDRDFVGLVAHITLDFRHPVLFGPDLLVTVSVHSVGARSYTLRFVAHQGQQLVFEASTVTVAMGADGRSRALKEHERAHLHSWLIDEN
jgi:acyl-CoA thioester hydrolase